MTVPIRIRVCNSTQPKMNLNVNRNHNSKRIMDVPIWTVEDVVSWVRRVGFGGYTESFIESGVDGDLLLQLDDSNLRNDVGMENGILRKRFTRELNSLKKNADYTCVDRHGVASFLSQVDQKIYAYGLIKLDLAPELMKKLNTSDLHDMLKEAGVNSTVHRHQIIEACHSQDEDLDSSFNDNDSLDNNNDVYDVYISHAGTHGSNELASLLAVHLQLRGFSVYKPSEHLDSSQRVCDTESCVLASSTQAVKKCKTLVLVLGAGALDNCLGDDHSRDRLHREVTAALQSKDCNIIPVTEADFQFPDPEELPEDMRAVCYFNSVRWVHDYQEACVDKLERFLRGEAFLRLPSCHNGSKTPTLNIPFSTQTSRSRTDSGRSSPARLTPIKVYRNRNDSVDSAISP